MVCIEFFLFCFSSDCGHGKQLCVNLRQRRNDDKLIQITIDIRVPESYPDSIPDIILDCSDLSRDAITAIRQDADKIAHQYLGEPMLFNIVNCIQEKLDGTEIHFGYDNAVSTELDIVWNALLTLDHMRAKTKYIKTIEKWTQELNLQGRLIFYGKLILILLQGSHAGIKVR